MQKNELPYISRRRLLTAGEQRFYLEGLLPAVGEKYHIAMKVRLADVLTVSKWESKHGRRIAQKHLDFVLVTKKATQIAVAVELNDKSHDEPQRQARDAFVGEALASPCDRIECLGSAMIMPPLIALSSCQRIGQSGSRVNQILQGSGRAWLRSFFPGMGIPARRIAVNRSLGFWGAEPRLTSKEKQGQSAKERPVAFE